MLKLRPQPRLLTYLPLIYQVARSLCFRSRVSRDERDDFESSIFALILADGCQALRQFRGEGSLAAYLRVVIHRLLLDYRGQKWGKWRPSTLARRLGRVAVELERLIERDGYSRWEAVRHLRLNLGVELSEFDLLDLAEQLPRRASRRFEGEEALRELPAVTPESERPDRCLQDEETKRVRAALAAALAGIDPDRRRLVTLHFVDGLTVAEIARRSGEDQRQLYWKLEGALGELRRRMLDLGTDRAAVRSVLERAA